MMKLIDMIAYICNEYPYKQELSKARLTKLIYLSDWRSTLVTGRPISNIEWIVNHYGPYVTNVIDSARSHPDLFDINTTRTLFGDPKETIQLKDLTFQPDLSDHEKAAIDHIILVTKQLNWDQFIRLVYSTYPVLTQPKFVPLDLPSLATKYQREVPQAETAIVTFT